MALSASDKQAYQAYIAQCQATIAAAQAVVDAYTESGGGSREQVAAARQTVAYYTSEVVQAVAALQPAPQASHVVQVGESVYDLAYTYYDDRTRYKDILQANGLQGPYISAGQVLSIPSATQ